MILQHNNIEFFETAGMMRGTEYFCGEDTIVFTVKSDNGWTMVSPAFVLRMNSNVSLLTQVKKILKDNSKFLEE